MPARAIRTVGAGLAGLKPDRPETTTASTAGARDDAAKRAIRHYLHMVPGASKVDALIALHDEVEAQIAVVLTAEHEKEHQA